jgi:hypothetical protein
MPSMGATPAPADPMTGGQELQHHAEAQGWHPQAQAPSAAQQRPCDGAFVSAARPAAPLSDAFLQT